MVGCREDYAMAVDNTLQAFPNLCEDVGYKFTHSAREPCGNTLKGTAAY